MAIFNIAGQIKSPTGSGVKSRIKITSLTVGSVLPFVKTVLDTDEDGNYTFTLGTGSFSLEVDYEAKEEKYYLPAVLTLSDSLDDSVTYSLDDLLVTEGVASHTPTLYEDA